MTRAVLEKRISAALFFLIAVNFAYWLASADTYGRWAGVPPVPSEAGILMRGLSDAQFSHRSSALTLQTLGDSGGKITPLKDYDYNKLRSWFFRLHGLDPASDHMPMVAAYYFGATRVPGDVRMVIDYLAMAGGIPVGDKWRWLAQAVYLAQHRLHDLDLALDLAYRLSRIPGDLPMWARQMPAFVLKEKGEREAARLILENLIATQSNLDPKEVNFMRAYLVEQLGFSSDEVERSIRMQGD